MDLRPFQGVFFQPAAGENLFDLLSPPYDIISQLEQDCYYRQHPYNVVRLIYGQEQVGDGPEDNRYTRAAQYLRCWLRQGILRRDPTPALYLCAEEFVLPDGRVRERQGLIALCRLEPYARGVILPHEETSARPKHMLLDLRSAVEANLDQVFALYAEESGQLQEILSTQRQQSARLSFRDRDHMLHRLWAISEPTLIQRIQQLMADNWAVIADGHHRYETCLNYQQMQPQSSAQKTDEAWFNYAMLYLTDIHDPGLVILPTHRLLRGLSPAALGRIPACLRSTCELEALPCRTPAERQSQGQRLLHEMRRRSDKAHMFGLYTGGEELWLLTYRGAETSSQALDVSLLHEVLLEKVLHLKPGEDAIGFTQDAALALDMAARQEYQLAFLLNPTRVEQVVQQARRGQRMPRKSTYFYPKLLTGVVIHKEVGDADYLG